MSGEANVAKAGLEGIVAAQSAISDVNGTEGRLIYAGYDIHDLAERSSFEEVIYLLWHLKLPTATELAELKNQLARESALPEQINRLIESLPADAIPIDVIRTRASAPRHYAPDSWASSIEATVRKDIRSTA